MNKSPLTKLLIELLEDKMEEITLSPFPEAALFTPINGKNLMAISFIHKFIGTERPQEKDHMLTILAFCISYLEQDGAHFVPFESEASHNLEERKIS